MKRGRPPKDPEDRRQYQRIAILYSTYLRATYNAAKKNQNILEYFDDIVEKEPEYENRNDNV